MLQQREQEMMVKTFEEIISQCCNNFPDNSQTEYLLIIGNKSFNNKLTWSSYIFNSIDELCL